MNPETVVRRMYQAANTRDLDAIDEIFAADFRSHPMGTTGRDPIRRAWRQVTERFPDLRIEPLEVITDGDRAAAWTRIHGPAEPATIMELVRVADGRIAELWGLSNLNWR
ncbi:ester cyclase [Paractinoplanes globisporus]|uniref:Ester cyclase n=1 Tax=Paractinoplanes globisporus TaxID=113565 RepID=A0ABW6WL44_9ACTN|nr:nuclear transport factor 2 family protein [Actinoplanes globisporus]